MPGAAAWPRSGLARAITGPSDRRPQSQGDAGAAVAVRYPCRPRRVDRLRGGNRPADGPLVGLSLEDAEALANGLNAVEVKCADLARRHVLDDLGTAWLYNSADDRLPRP